MKHSVALKTLYRTPGKTVITFLLLVVLTFSLFLQLAEYHATAKEFAENVEMYAGTGYVEKVEATYTGMGMLQYPYYIATDSRVANAIGADLPDLMGFDYASITADEIMQLLSLSYISSGQPRYMTAGRSEYLRLRDDDMLWDNNSLVVVEGTLGEPCLVVTHPNPYYAYPAEQAFSLANAELLAGDMDLEQYKEMGHLNWQRNYENMKSHLGPEYVEKWFPPGSVKPGELYFQPVPWVADDVPFMEADWTPSCTKDDMNMYNAGSSALAFKLGNIILKNYRYGLDIQTTWTQGRRYVFVLRCSHEDCDLQPLSLNLYDWLSDHFCPAVWDVTDAPENYIELPEYAPLKQLMEIIESDRNTLDVVYTGDMSAIKLVKDGKMALADGRWLTRSDTETGASVCMLDEKFARTYGLKVGDTLPLELGDKLFEQFYNLGAIAGTVERYADNWITAEFEIVGLYKNQSTFAAAKEPNWNYSVNTVFVPLSALPATVDLTDHEFAPGEFTFRVDNAWDIASFLEETAPRIEAMGLTLMFDDGGWMEVYTPYISAQRTALTRIKLLAIVTGLATAFVVYLFISRKRKDYAIMRALGTPKGKSNGSLLLPLMVLTAVSVVAGLVAATVYIRRRMAAPLTLALLCGSAELAHTLLLALGMLWRLGRKSPLALLQGEQAKKRKARGVISVGRDDLGTPPDSSTDTPQPGEIDPPYCMARRVVAPYTRGPCGKYRPRPVRFTLRYILRHIRRSAVKSLLSILVAALMLAAAAQLGYLHGVYDRLRTDTVVTAVFNTSIILPKLKDLEADGLVADLYYERNLDGVIVLEYADTPEVHIALTNDVAKYVGIPREITYAAGHGPEDMEITGKYVLLGSALIDEFGISPGETVRICKLIETDSFIQTESRRLQVEFPGEYSDERRSLWEVWPDYMEQELDKLCDTLTVIGTVSTGNSTYDSMVFTPGMETTKKFMNDTLLEYAQFRVPDNARAQEMKSRGEEMTGHRQGAFSIDIEKLESVERTAHLLETLYPIVVALTLIIGAFLCALIILQTAKDAAIMRIQGTSAAMTRAILAVEQVLLAVLGVSIGVAVMAAIKGRNFPLIAKQTLTFAGAYIAVAAVASTVSAILATKKNLLELLQTKE